jgi:hypothetical protein
MLSGNWFYSSCSSTDMNKFYKVILMEMHGAVMVRHPIEWSLTSQHAIRSCAPYTTPRVWFIIIIIIVIIIIIIINLYCSNAYITYTVLSLVIVLWRLSCLHLWQHYRSLSRNKRFRLLKVRKKNIYYLQFQTMTEHIQCQILNVHLPFTCISL